MTFLTVLIIVFFYLNWIGSNPLREVVPFGPWAGWCRRTLSTPNVSFLVCAGVPSLIVFFLASEIGSWFMGLPWLLLSLAVLVYAIDEQATDAMFDEQARVLDELESDNTADVDEAQDEFEQLVVYENFQGLYPPLFWFLLGGPAFALLYILVRLYLESLEDDDPEIDFADQVIYWMEWPPSRLSGLVFALVGHFARGLDAFMHSFMDLGRAHSALLADWARAASGPNVVGDLDAVEYSHEVSRELKDLLNRTLFGWVGIAAIVAIMGW